MRSTLNQCNLLFLIVLRGITNTTILIECTIILFISPGSNIEPKRRKLIPRYYFGFVIPISTKRLIPIYCVPILQTINTSTNNMVPNIEFI